MEVGVRWMEMAQHVTNNITISNRWILVTKPTQSYETHVIIMTYTYPLNKDIL
jgi:hypothetical protein